MKVEYINPFVEASISVFKTVLNTDATIGKLYLKNSPYIAGDMVIMIGVVGGIRGQVCLELNLDTAERIVGVMMDGITVANMDEVGKSAIAELGNMIMGNACTLFSKSKLNIDITPPTVLTGEKISVSNKVPTIGVPLILQDYGTIHIQITAEEVL